MRKPARVEHSHLAEKFDRQNETRSGLQEDKGKMERETERLKEEKSGDTGFEC